MIDLVSTIDTYLAAYSEPDAGARLGLLRDAFAPDGRLIDPPLEGSGIDGINEMMGAVHQQFPGHRFRRTTGVDEHHGYVRYGWELVAPAGDPVLTGMDIGEVGGGGIVRIVGFFDPVPARA